jgi:hypothetical protein
MVLNSAGFFLRFCRLGRFLCAVSVSFILFGSEGSIEAGGLETGGMEVVFSRGRREVPMSSLARCSVQLSPLPIVSVTAGSLTALMSNGCQWTPLDLRSFAFYWLSTNARHNFVG